jgi:hypothetical protein
MTARFSAQTGPFFVLCIQKQAILQLIPNIRYVKILQKMHVGPQIGLFLVSFLKAVRVTHQLNRWVLRDPEGVLR